MKRKITALLLVLTMTVGMTEGVALPAAAQAADIIEEQAADEASAQEEPLWVSAEEGETVPGETGVEMDETASDGEIEDLLIEDWFSDVQTDGTGEEDASDGPYIEAQKSSSYDEGYSDFQGDALERV